MHMREMNSWIQTIQQVYDYWDKDELMSKPIKVIYNIYIYCKNVLAQRAKIKYVERIIKKSDIFEYNEEDGCWYDAAKELISDSDLADYE